MDGSQRVQRSDAGRHGRPGLILAALLALAASPALAAEGGGPGKKPLSTEREAVCDMDERMARLMVKKREERVARQEVMDAAEKAAKGVQFSDLRANLRAWNQLSRIAYDYPDWDEDRFGRIVATFCRQNGRNYEQ